LKPEDLAAAPPARLPFPVTRAVSVPVEARAEGDGMPVMTGHFSTFGDWYEVNSIFEGHFLESVDRSAFDQTIAANRSNMKVLYDHGQDPQIGNKILGPIDDLTVDGQGPRYTVPLFDTSYNRDLAPGLEAGVYGSSFRFTVEADEWDQHPERSDYNPDGIPERRITRANVAEFGPVTFPANAKADAGTRSTTDIYYQRSRDAEGYESLMRSAQAARSPKPSAAPAVPATPLRAAQKGNKVDDTKYLTRDEMGAREADIQAELVDIANDFPGVLPEDAQVRWDTKTAEQDELRANMKAYDARQARLAVQASVPGGSESGTYVPARVSQINKKAERDLYTSESRGTTPEERGQEFRDDALRILELTNFPPLADEARSTDKLAYLLDHADSPDKELARRIKYTGAPVYMRAFEKIIKARGSTLGLTPEEQRGTALAVGVDGTGGFAVPFAFDPTVIHIGSWTGSVNPYRRVARIVTIVGTDTWNAVTATAVTATRTTEAAAATEQGPTFAQPQYIVTRAQGQITASFEMFQDRADLASELATLIAEAKDNEEETSFATGAGAGTAMIGVGPVNGTSGAYTASGQTIGAGVIAAGDADAVEAALPARHRFGAQWFMNRVNIRKFQSVETAGGKLFQQSQYFQSAGNVDVARDGNTGLRLLGYPVNESPSLPTATTANIVIGTLLNPNSYVIVDRVGLQVQFIPFIFNSSALATGQQALYFLYRNMAKPLNVDGGRTLRFQ
jgi:HK97 family phage major capsid protein